MGSVGTTHRPSRVSFISHSDSPKLRGILLMTSRELVRKTLEFENHGRIPRQIWVLPWAVERYPDHVQKLKDRFPDDIAGPPVVYNQPLVTVGDRYKPGTYVDEWGCEFTNNESGIIGAVFQPRIRTWDDLDGFQPPESTLSVDREAVNAFCRESDRFVTAGNLARPFERFQFLRTMEQAMVDLALEPPELDVLLHRIHEHTCREVELWASTDVDAVMIMDDWGSQDRLMTRPEVFRKRFKPMYREYAEIARQHGKWVFMHSDGFILDIIPDLIECGINALNSQVFCMGPDVLGSRFRGRLTFWGEIDRQHLLPHGSRKDIEDAVFQCAKNLDSNGGAIAQCEFGPGANPENVRTVFEAWEKVR
jgi:uroporphyrinogen decarboxylase